MQVAADQSREGVMIGPTGAWRPSTDCKEMSFLNAWYGASVKAPQCVSGIIIPIQITNSNSGC